jgi:hypothetical protein
MDTKDDSVDDVEGTLFATEAVASNTDTSNCDITAATAHTAITNNISLFLASVSVRRQCFNT